MSTHDANDLVEKPVAKAGKSGRLVLIFTVVAVLVLAVFSFLQHKSIVEREQAIGALQEQNQAYLVEQGRLNDYVEEVTRTVGEIGGRLSDVRQKQVVLSNILTTGETTGTTRDSIMADIALIESQLVADRKNIEDLQEKMKKSSVRIRSLEKMVAKLQQEIVENQQQIASLSNALAEKDLVIKSTRETLARTQTDLALTDTKLRETEQTLEDTRNTAYYVAGKAKELEKRKIIERSGIFRKKNILTAEFEKSSFTRVDISSNSVLQFDCRAKDLELVPPRSSESYAIAEVEKGKSVLRILDRERFWNVPYLVVVMD
ncbi:MAG: hypothetical protein JXQ83_14865 [Candidatus Glassbacteria bacterium]|nr:hypothetical protein [Candidatus Glassbacteria bacterium]